LTKGFKKRRLAVALSACMMATSGLVHALGMGEIEVSTALNEPLDAKIKLFSATQSELKSLGVSLASRDAFERVGIDRLPILRELEFELVSSGAGAPYIKVVSSKAIKEPFLDFILSINWSSGQMMREYTLLLDPPVFEKEPQTGRISAATTQPGQVVRQSPAVAVAEQPRVAPTGSYGPTSRQDTLWGVARNMRPDSSVSVPQMMIGLLKENPEAFGNNNINNLMAGHILRTPEMDVITELSKQQAAAEANRQYQDWQSARGKSSAVGRQQRVVAPTPASAVGKASTSAVTPAVVASTPTEARLQLLTPEEEAKVRSGVGSGAASDGVESLQRQLAVALEASEARGQENSDLRLRLDELEKQLQSVQKLLTLKDDSLGALQADAQLKQQVEAATATLDAVKPEVDVAAVPKQPVKPVVQPESMSVSLIDDILANPTNPMYMAAGGGIVALLLLVALIMRRRSQSGADDDFSVMAPVDTVADIKSDDVAKSAVASSLSETASVEASTENEDDVSIDDFGGGLGAIHTEESEIDPIAEADVYLAYRRYEQAEALLKEAINADAGRHELKVKLLEIYHATKDVDSFEAQAESLYAVLAGQEEGMWDQVVEMGRELLPDHPLFAGGSAVSTVAEGGLTESDLGFEPSDSVEELSFDDPQPLSVDDAEVSDGDLAESLGLSGLTDELGEFEGLESSDSATEVDGVSLDEIDLGELDLDLDLDLSAADEGVAADTVLDDLDLGADGLEAIPDVADLPDGLSGLDVVDELADADERDLASEDIASISDGLADLGGEVEEDSILDLGAELSDSLEDGIMGELDELATGEVDAQVADIDFSGEEAAILDEVSEGFDEPETVAKPVLSLAEGDQHLDNTENTLAEVDLDAFSSGASESWDIEAAQSVFSSRDVDGETDGLLDSARNPDDEDNSIELGIPLSDELNSGVTEPESKTDAAVQESVVSEMETDFDPLADIANLGEMDFSQMADEDNDDIFDNSGDMVGTKLDLAKAYIDMGDQDGARSILDEVVGEGDDDQRQEAEQLKQQIS